MTYHLGVSLLGFKIGRIYLSRQTCREESRDHQRGREITRKTFFVKICFRQV